MLRSGVEDDFASLNSSKSVLNYWCVNLFSPRHCRDNKQWQSFEGLLTVCMCHLTFNFKSKVSRDVFKNKNAYVNQHVHFFLEYHLNVTSHACHTTCQIQRVRVN